MVGSLLKCWMSGGNSMGDIVQPLRAALADTSVATELLPRWASTGWPDDGCTLHSCGVSFWTLLGNRLGCESLAEMPAPCHTAHPEIRSDSAWFTPTDGPPVLLVEFERYAGEADSGKLHAKVRNLARAADRWRSETAVLVLAYWTQGLTNLPDHENLRGIISSGIGGGILPAIPPLPRTRLLFFQFVHQAAINGRWRLHQILERGVP